MAFSDKLYGEETEKEDNAPDISLKGINQSTYHFKRRQRDLFNKKIIDRRNQKKTGSFFDNARRRAGINYNIPIEECYGKYSKKLISEKEKEEVTQGTDDKVFEGNDFTENNNIGSDEIYDFNEVRELKENIPERMLIDDYDNKPVFNIRLLNKPFKNRFEKKQRNVVKNNRTVEEISSASFMNEHMMYQRRYEMMRSKIELVKLDSKTIVKSMVKDKKPIIIIIAAFVVFMLAIYAFIMVVILMMAGVFGSSGLM